MTDDARDLRNGLWTASFLAALVNVFTLGVIGITPATTAAFIIMLVLFVAAVIADNALVPGGAPDGQ